MGKEGLNSKEIIKKIEENKNKIHRFGVKKIGLFGSFIKNKQKRKSDIDILVTFDNPQFDSYMELKFLLERLFKKS